MDILKDLSDRFLIWFLKSTSGFGGELTREGRLDQELWRERRLRNLKGLSIRSAQRHGKKSEPK